jgi:hypothetical protein
MQRKTWYSILGVDTIISNEQAYYVFSCVNSRNLMKTLEKQRLKKPKRITPSEGSMMKLQVKKTASKS